MKVVIKLAMRRRRKVLLALLLTIALVIIVSVLTPKLNYDEIRRQRDVITCPCHEVTFVSSRFQSTCSRRSTSRGPGQNVVAFTFFGPLYNTDGTLNWYAKVSAGACHWHRRQSGCRPHFLNACLPVGNRGERPDDSRFLRLRLDNEDLSRR